MRNEDPKFFYSSRIQIFNSTTTVEVPEDTSSSKVDLQFFPEGGTIVAGIQTRLAFKAIDSYGRGLEVEGKIVDQKNRVVSTFKSTHRGMGVFPLEPDINQSLRAILPGDEVLGPDRCYLGIKSNSASIGTC